MLAQVDLRQYIYELMVSTGGCASAGYPIASCKIYSDKSYAFLEFRSVEEASNCMAFDGVAFKDSYLRVRCGDRNCDYEPGFFMSAHWDFQGQPGLVCLQKR